MNDNAVGRCSVVQVAHNKIGLIIGSGGKNVKKIIAMTGVKIDIGDDGTVKVCSRDDMAIQEAIKWVKILSGDIEIGSEFEGKVSRHAEFGMFVDIFLGVGGLIHISTIDREKQQDLSKNYPIGSFLDVKVVGYDRESGRIRLVAPEIEFQRSH